jgi:hypothetical protein
MRGIFEWLGADVEYFPGGELVSVYPQSVYPLAEGETRISLRLKVGSTRAQLNDKKLTLLAPPVVKGGCTYVPLRFVGEALGAQVTFDAAKGRITITKGAKVGELAVASAPPSAKPRKAAAKPATAPRHAVLTVLTVVGYLNGGGAPVWAGSDVALFREGFIWSETDRRMMDVEVPYYETEFVILKYTHIGQFSQEWRQLSLRLQKALLKAYDAELSADEKMRFSEIRCSRPPGYFDNQWLLARKWLRAQLPQGPARDATSAAEGPGEGLVRGGSVLT